MSTRLGSRDDKLTARLLGLHRLATTLTVRHDRSELARLVLSTTARLLGVESAALFLWNPRQQTLEFAGAAPTPMPDIDCDKLPGEGVVGLCWQRQKTSLINGYAEYRHANPEAKRLGIRSCAAAPLLLDETCIGVLVVRSCDPNQYFDPEDGLLLELLAGQTAAALERTQLAEAGLESVETSRALLRLAREVGVATDEAGLVQRAADLAVELFGADACIATLRDPIDGSFRGATYSGDVLASERAYLESQFGIRQNERIRERASSMSAPILVDDAARAGYYSSDFLAHVRRRSSIHVPLVVGDGAVGFMGIHWTQTQRHFGECEQTLAEGLARLLSGALERVRGFRQVKLLSDAVSASIDGIAVADLEGRIQSANPAYAKLLGRPSAELLGLNLEELHSPERAESLPATGWLADVLAQGDWAGEVVAARPDGSTLVARLSVAVARDEAGRPASLCAVLRDLTAELGVRERLLRLEKLRALGQLAAGTAHDLNNLLTLVLGKAELARTRLLNGKATRLELLDALRAIERTAEDGASTVRHIQEFARVRPERPPTRVPVSPLVSEVLDLTRPRWQDEPQRRGVRINVSRRVEVGLACAGEAAELREALINVVLNALDAMPDGGQLQIRGDLFRDRVRLRITDSGVGMDEATRRQIFDPFFSTKGERGTGLGLSMVYNIVQRHAGEILVESEPGRGTTFTLLLPVARQLAREERPEDRSTSALTGARVLVVDDEPGLANVLGQVIGTAAHQVTTCTSAEEALDLIRRDRFDVLVTDLGMPGIDGLELSARARSRDERLAVVLVTGWANQVDLEEVRRFGVSEVVPKPYRIRAVVEAVSRALEQRSQL